MMYYFICAAFFGIVTTIYFIVETYIEEECITVKTIGQALLVGIIFGLLFPVSITLVIVGILRSQKFWDYKLFEKKKK